MNNPLSVVVRSLGGGARPPASALGKRSGACGGGRSVLASRPGFVRARRLRVGLSSALRRCLEVIP